MPQFPFAKGLRARIAECCSPWLRAPRFSVGTRDMLLEAAPGTPKSWCPAPAPHMCTSRQDAGLGATEGGSGDRDMLCCAMPVPPHLPPPALPLRSPRFTVWDGLQFGLPGCPPCSLPVLVPNGEKER